MIKNSELHSLKNLERFKNVKKHQKLWITTNINSKLKIEFGIALTINKGSFRNCTHSTFGVALTRIRNCTHRKSSSNPFLEIDTVFYEKYYKSN